MDCCCRRSVCSDLLQKALTGRKLILQELYKYYSWSPEADGASRHQKLTMSAENFVKLATDAKLLSNQVRHSITGVDLLTE